MTDTTTHHFEESAARIAPVRIVMLEGRPWLVLADVCKILGLKNTTHAASRIPPSNRRRVRVSGRKDPAHVIDSRGLNAITAWASLAVGGKLRAWFAKTVEKRIEKGADVMATNADASTSKENAAADRFSAALTEIGEAAIALVMLEREACAALLEAEAAKGGGGPTWADAFVEAAKLIRSRS
jgi:prophage antirepressor-like protein